MYEQFCSRYEDGLKLIVKGVTTKGGVKKYDRVNQRIGRLAQKYLYYVRSTSIIVSAKSKVLSAP